MTRSSYYFTGKRSSSRPCASSPFVSAAWLEYLDRFYQPCFVAGGGCLSPVQPAALDDQITQRTGLSAPPDLCLTLNKSFLCCAKILKTKTNDSELYKISGAIKWCIRRFCYFFFSKKMAPSMNINSTNHGSPY